MPPVNTDIRSPANPRLQGFEGRRPWAEPAPILSDSRRIGAGPDPLPSVKAQAWQLSAGNVTPSSGAAWAAPNGRGLRQSGSNGYLHINPSSPTAGLISRGSLGGSKPHTPTGLTPRRNPATDLDTLAGDRWFQTSITCSKSAPALHAVNPQSGISNHGPEVKGLGSTVPFAGLEPGNPRAAGSGSLAARLAPAPPVSSPRRNTLPSIHRTQSEAAGAARNHITPGNRPQGAAGSRPQVSTGSRQPAPPPGPAPPPKTSASAGTDAGEAAADRPPTRSGQRPARLQTGGKDSKGTSKDSKVEPESPTTPTSRKASCRPSGRHGSRVSVSDLMD